MTSLRVLDLFSGLGGWSTPFADRGHEVRTLDFNPEFGATYCLDIREFAKDPDAYLHDWRPDVVVSSPDCRGFSVAALGRNWRLTPAGDYIAKTDTARLGVELVAATLRIIDVLAPRFWVMENPRAILRKLGLMAQHPRVTVTYCQYGMPYQKPTDLWGRFPKSWVPRPMCKPKSPCHESAPRGSRRGIQRIGSKDADQWDYGTKIDTTGKTWRQLHPESLGGAKTTKPPTYRRNVSATNHQRGQGQPKPITNGPRAAAIRALIPPELALEFCLACEGPDKIRGQTTLALKEPPTP